MPTADQVELRPGDEIRAAIDEGDFDEAGRIHDMLLLEFPGPIRGDQELAAMVEAISEAARVSAGIKLVGKEVPAETSSPPSPISTAVDSAQTVNEANVPNVEGHTVVVLADGVANGLDASTGRLLWRRFLGTRTPPRRIPFCPKPLSDDPGSDVLLVDPVRNEVLRVEATTGRLRWRHPVGERFDAQPVVVDDKVLVAAPSGRLGIIDAATGASSSYVQLPQSLEVAPAIDAGRGLIFQPAAHHNLFVVSLQGICQQVVYLGHERGTMTTPRVMGGKYVILAVNEFAEDSSLHVLSIGLADDPDAPLCQKLQKIRLKGHVDVPPLIEGRTVLVTTDLGAIYVFFLDGDNPEAPLSEIAQKTSTIRKTDFVRYATMEGGLFWLADTELAKYNILRSRMRISLRWVVDENSEFLQAPVAIGEATFQVRRKKGTPGAIVSAVGMEEPTLYWETRIPIPQAGDDELQKALDGLEETAPGKDETTPKDVIAEPDAAADGKKP